MVKNDQQNLGISWICFSFCALIGTLSLAANPGNFVLVAYWTALAIWSFDQAQRWKPMNYRRQMAAAWGFAARVPLAQPHPLPNVGALPVPFTITLKPNWPKFLLGLGLLSGAALFIIGSFYPLMVEHGVPLFDPVLGSLFLLMFLGACAMLSLWLRPQRIEVTQEGLIIRHATGRIRGTDWIRWSDARLLAIRGGKLGAPGTRYELSGPYSVVQWTRTRHPRRWSLYRPAIPFGEYDAQMEALIALISGITGLPLYDVR